MRHMRRFKTESISSIAYLFSHSLHPPSRCSSHTFSMVSHLNVFLTCLLILEPHTLILVPLTEARRKRIALGKGLFYLSILLSINISIYQFIYLFIYSSIYIYPYIYLSIHVSMTLSNHIDLYTLYLHMKANLIYCRK